VTVVDTSGVVDFLLGVGAATQVEALLTEETELAAPDLLIFEVLAVLRREVGRGGLSSSRATAAINDLGDVQIVLFPALPLRTRAWALRTNLTAADAIFVALAEHLGEPFATKDQPLARAVMDLTAVKIIPLAEASDESSTDARDDPPNDALADSGQAPPPRRQPLR
jgi:predicted nucleic acid-binding protein